MSGCHSKNSSGTHSLFKTMLWKIGDRYQVYCTTYRTHAMGTHHRGTGHPVGRGIDLHIEDMEGIKTGPDKDNESTSGSHTTIALGGSEAAGHPSELLPSNQAKLTALRREIHNLHQWVKARESQPGEGLDHIDWELQNLSHTSATTHLNPNTCWTLWRGNTSVHQHILHYSETNRPTQFTTTGYHCL